MSEHRVDENQYDRAARTLRDTLNGIAITGAGISVESGIADFRSAGGLWSRYNPAEYATMEAFLDNDKVWNMWYELADTLQMSNRIAHYAWQIRGTGSYQGDYNAEHRRAPSSCRQDGNQYMAMRTPLYVPR